MVDVTSQLNAWLEEYGAQDANAARLLCDRHRPEAPAFVVVDPITRASRTISYGELADTSSRMATLLHSRGVRRGDRVPVLMEKGPELLAVLVALWRLGAVHVPLFTAFTSGAIRVRVEGSGATHVVTDTSQRRKLDPFGDLQVLELGSNSEDELSGQKPWADPAAVGGDGELVLLFTSGTTGKPKGVSVPVRALASFQAYMEFGLDVQDDDVFWNAADPGWAYGLYYGVLGPLVTGHANLIVQGGFDPELTVDVLREFGVSNFAGAPTIYRALGQLEGPPSVNLRRASSAGEPLTPDVVEWSRLNLGVEVRDHYGQTELGMVIANCWDHRLDPAPRPGSMGRAMPGFSATVLEGQIAIAVEDSPLLWFSGYLDDPERSAERFSVDRRWYLTADSGRQDQDGHFYFTARDDDVILAAGYRIGPFDVESVMVTHPAVAEVAVVGRPDPSGVRGEAVVAFVVLTRGFSQSDALVLELQEYVRDNYSKHAYPRQIHFLDQLPKTPSGKVQRFILRQTE